MSKLELRVVGVTIKPSEDCLSRHETMVMVAKVTLRLAGRSRSYMFYVKYPDDRVNITLKLRAVQSGM